MKKYLLELLRQRLREELDRRVDAVCSQFGASVISGKRSIWRNQQVGGVKLSWHLDDLARDLAFDSKFTVDDAIKFLTSDGILRITKNGSTGLHVQFDFPVLPCEREDELSHLEVVLKEIL